MHWHQLRSQISQVFQVTSHVVWIFALHFVSPIQLLSLYQFIQFLTCTRIPCRDSHCENGLVRCCLYRRRRAGWCGVVWCVGVGVGVVGVVVCVCGVGWCVGGGGEVGERGRGERGEGGTWSRWDHCTKSLCSWSAAWCWVWLRTSTHAIVLVALGESGDVLDVQPPASGTIVHNTRTRVAQSRPRDHT